MILPEFFLASNSANGFVSHFCSNYDAEDGWKAYIIKGGAGTGKSSLMRQVAKEAQENKTQVVYCLCSSDPNSLDGVIFPEKKYIILDGTAPHIVEPKFPAICEQIVNTGQFWDDKKLCGKEKELIKLYKENSALHKRAQQYIIAAGNVTACNLGYALTAVDIDKAFDFAFALSQKHLPKTNGKAKEWVRFLGGITPKGYLFLGDTLDFYADEKIVIRDRNFAVSSIILSAIRDIALKKGYEIITVKNALLPNDITEHIIIPSLRIAFCTDCESYSLESRHRIIHARRFTDMTLLHKNMQKMTFNRKLSKQLIFSAVNCLKEAKLTHDKIEKYYIDIMDFSHFKELASEIAQNILEREI